MGAERKLFRQDGLAPEVRFEERSAYEATHSFTD